MSTGDQKHTQCSCKVGRVASKLGLDDIDEELPARWLGEDDLERHGVRTLAEYFNKKVFRAAVRRSDADIMDSQADYFFKVLMADPSEGEPDNNVTKAEREELVSELKQKGVDVEKLENNFFISYQSIHNHLTKCLDVSAPTNKKSPEETLESDKDTIRQMGAKQEQIGEAMLKRNLDLDDEQLEKFDVSDQITVRCDECGYKKPLLQMLDEDGCYCEDAQVESDTERGEKGADGGVPQDEDGDSDSETVQATVTTSHADSGNNSGSP